jgi:hypothetical protein
LTDSGDSGSPSSERVRSGETHRSPYSRLQFAIRSGSVSSTTIVGDDGKDETRASVAGGAPGRDAQRSLLKLTKRAVPPAARADRAHATRRLGLSI